MTDGTGTRQYAYVPVGAPGALQLQQDSGPLPSSAITSAYDALGRLSQRTVQGAGAETFQYDAIGRLSVHTDDLGSFTLGYLDLRMGGFGVPFQALRRYSSGTGGAGSFGAGWAWSYDVRVVPREKNPMEQLMTAFTGGSSEDEEKDSQWLTASPASTYSSLAALAMPYLSHLDPVRVAAIRSALARLELLGDEHVVLTMPEVYVTH